MEQNNNELNVCEIYQGVQGEGKHIGLNVVFLRLVGCNLGCQFCDSKYHTQGRIMNIKDIEKEIIKYDINGIVITGGEPLLQKYALSNLLNKLQDYNYNIIVETNGTISPIDTDLWWQVNHWAVSPKLVSSGNDIDKRINYDALNDFNDTDSIFKFVIASDDDLKEALLLKEKVPLDKDKIYLMPEGQTTSEINLRNKSIIEQCLKLGFNFSPRLHVMIYNNKRRV